MPIPHVNNIISLIESPTKPDIELIKQAYEYAQVAHSGQKRYSGEPYFNHVYETALILAELGMRSKTIAAGLLHDVIEDVDGIDAPDIQKEFGDEILFLVEGVSKLGEIRYKGLKRHIESLRRLFIATSRDIRVLIIKLSDRLHNMRTLEYVPEHKQKRIATETMEVYAPIAHRLGIGKFVGELEDLSFKYIDPDNYKKVQELSREKYKESLRRLEKIHKKLKTTVAEEKIHNFRTDYRRKHLYSLWRKLKRKDMDINRVYDISALRVIVHTVSDCYRVLGVVHGLWRPLPGRIKDYIAFPKPNGYQSIHTTIFTGEGTMAEIQIRTERMHRDAEYGIASHVDYKQGSSGSDWIKEIIPILNSEGLSEKDLTEQNVPDWIKEMAEAQKEVTAPTEFLDNLKTDFFENRIFVFTPNGDVIDLPTDSTPVDFAYHIHSDIGDHMSGAKVNGKLVSLDSALGNGDIVEILTNRNSKPTTKWLEYAKTAMARRKIRSSLSDERKNS